MSWVFDHLLTFIIVGGGAFTISLIGMRIILSLTQFKSLKQKMYSDYISELQRELL